MWGWESNPFTAHVLAVQEIRNRAHAKGVLAQPASLGLGHPGSSNNATGNPRFMYSGCNVLYGQALEVVEAEFKRSHLTSCDAADVVHSMLNVSATHGGVMWGQGKSHGS